MRSNERQPMRQFNVIHQNLLGTPTLPVLGDRHGSPESVLQRERQMEQSWLKVLGSTVRYFPGLG